MARRRITKAPVIDRRQLGLFGTPPPATSSPPTSPPAKRKPRKPRKSDAARRAYFAGLAKGRREAAPNPPAEASRCLEELPELRERVIALLCADGARIASVAQKARVSIAFVRDVVADEFDRQRAVREAIAVTRALEREPVTRRAPRARRKSVRAPASVSFPLAGA